jgi:hypothetical protein
MKNDTLINESPARTSSRSARKLERTRRGNGAGESHVALRIVGVLVGRLAGFEQSGGPLVDFPGNASARPRAALSVLALEKDAIGRQVVLMFEEGDPQRPVVLGLVEDRDAKLRQPVELGLDGTRLVFSAEHEIVLRCGKASITLTRAGKVLIRGAYLLNRSSGVNRIKGGSVQIN